MCYRIGANNAVADAIHLLSMFGHTNINADLGLPCFLVQDAKKRQLMTVKEPGSRRIVNVVDNSQWCDEDYDCIDVSKEDIQVVRFHDDMESRRSHESWRGIIVSESNLEVRDKKMALE